MQNCGASLLALLEGNETDFVDVYEFYDQAVTNLVPEEATKLFAPTSLVWFGYQYTQQAITRGDISRFIDGKFNNVSMTFSNVDRELASFLYTNIEGYRVVVRMISRSVDDDSLVLFVGRCEKAVDVDNTTAQVSAKQDLGSIENDLPWNVFAPKCPLEFKGTECLAGRTAAAIGSAYQAATTCNKSYGQCSTYGNTHAFQGLRFNAVTGNFKVSQRRGGAGGAFLGLLGLGNKRVTKQYSSQDDAPYGKAVPLGLGRTQIELTPVVSADTGQYLAGQWIVGEGRITKLLNTRNVSSGWANTFQAYADHDGAYGPDSEQAPAGFFTSTGVRHSHRAYVEATIKGDNPDTGDPAPTLAANVLWLKIPKLAESCFTGNDWSDNPVEHVRFLLTEARSLAYDSTWIDNKIAADTAEYCNYPMIDETGAEDVYVSSSAGTAGTDYKRYRSTGLLDTYYWLYYIGSTSTYPAEREVTYNTFNPASSTTPAATTYYRKRYTANWHLKERIKAADFIFKSLLPSFRGYLITGADGKLQIKSKRPAVSSYLRSTASAGATTLAIEDALAWKNLRIPVVFCLVGANTSTSETRRVTKIEYSTTGNSITLTGSGGCSVSGATFSGGTTTTQANALVTVNSAASSTVVIDGVSIAYTANANDTTGTVAAMLATMVNANTTLQRYVEALWTKDQPTIVILRSKLGTLTLATALTYTHSTLKQVVHIHLPFSDVAFGALSRGNILKGSHRWPMGGKQSSYNQFVMTFSDAVQDYQPTELRENDYGHQSLVNKINRMEIDGSCVDNYHQADRLVQGTRYEYRDGDFFVTVGSRGLSLLLEEGDIICSNHANMTLRRNLLMRVEEVKVSADHKTSVLGRLYSDAQFPNSATPATIVLTTGSGWASTPPGQPTNLVLTEPTSGTLRGAFTFAGYIGSQTARVEVLRAGETAYVDTGIRVTPDANNDGQFEITGLPSGVTYVRITPYSAAGDGTALVSSYDTANADIDVLEYQVTNRPEDNLQLEIYS